MTDRKNAARRRLEPVSALLAVGLLLALTAGAASAAGQPAPAWQGSLTPSPTTDEQLQLPTATATQIGGPTATTTPTATLVPVLAETIGDPTTNLRSGPGLDFDVLAELPPATTLPITGRWLGYQWYQVAWEDGPDGVAWVYEPLVVVRGDITTVPAVEPPSAPTADPNLAGAEATAAVLVLTPGAAETATATAFFQPTGVFTQTPSGSGAGGGPLPTFTPPDPYVQPQEIAAPAGSEESQSAFPPAAVILTLAGMGVLMLLLGVLRRIF